MFTTEKKLAIEVTEIDCIEIDDVNLAESREDEVFEKLTTDATSADEKNARLWRREVYVLASILNSHRSNHWVMRDHVGPPTF